MFIFYFAEIKYSEKVDMKLSLKK